MILKREPKEKPSGDCPRTPCSASSFTVMKVISSHPEWDEDDGDDEYEVAHFTNKADADEAAKNLGGSNGGPCNRAYRHYVRTNLPNKELYHP